MTGATPRIPRPRRPLRGVVVGAGSMGRNHVRVLSDMPDVDLMGVVDPDPVSRALALRGRASTMGYESVSAQLQVSEPDFAVVATPTRSHVAAATELLQAGVHCLVEKPLAPTRPEGEQLSDLAATHGLHLAVGHVERYNPAILQLRDRLARGDAGAAHLLAARRTGPFPARINDVGVITDLATHDVDIMRMLTGSVVERVYAETAQRISQVHEDLFAGTLRFAAGQIGLLDINWLTPFKTRELTVVCERGTYVADYLTQQLSFYENAHEPGEWETLRTFSGVAEGDMVRYSIPRVEPLRAELRDFLAAVSGEESSYVRAGEALLTLDVTTALLASAGSAREVVLHAAALAP